MKTVIEVAKEFNVNRRTVYNWIKVGKLDADTRKTPEGRVKVLFIFEDEKYKAFKLSR